MKDCKNLTGLAIFACCFILLCVLLFTGKAPTMLDKVLALVTLVATGAITGAVGKNAGAAEIEEEETISGEEDGQ